MPPTVRIAPAEGLPEGASVGHIDELRRPAKERLPELVGDGGTTTEDAALGTTADRFDVVKFTEYYEIQRVGGER
jgi:hypothetical protein